MTTFTFSITAEGVLSCDGTACDEDCPIHQELDR
jgi:hypothetical protein